ncbi:MAG TPA: hypothetical protein VGN60_12725 [Devosia sp.]|jgi:hypothetical protein|nr:hypothetical protein [Devosia sp.]
MERHSQVLEVEIDHNGEAHHATYFVEQNMIHTAIDGRLMTIPVGQRSAAETVKSVLSGFLAQKARKRRHVSRWRLV